MIDGNYHIFANTPAFLDLNISNLTVYVIGSYHPLYNPQVNLRQLGNSLIVVCTYHYVITSGLHSRYDVDGHYFRFVVQILVNSH